jgi:hypothetical protein
MKNLLRSNTIWNIGHARNQLSPRKELAQCNFVHQINSRLRVKLMGYGKVCCTAIAAIEVAFCECR